MAEVLDPGGETRSDLVEDHLPVKLALQALTDSNICNRNASGALLTNTLIAGFKPCTLGIGVFAP